MPVRNETLELKVKQGLQREAFDVALQRADHRRTMDSRDRVVAVGVKQTLAIPMPDHKISAMVANRSEPSVFALLKSSPLSEPFDIEHAAPSVETGCSELITNKSPSEIKQQGCTTESIKLLSHESLAMLLKQVQSSHYQFGESIVLEVVDDPNGVTQISLTRGLGISWAVELMLSARVKRDGANESALSESLFAQLQQSGISVDAVSVENHPVASLAMVSADG